MQECTRNQTRRTRQKEHIRREGDPNRRGWKQRWGHRQVNRFIILWLNIMYLYRNDLLRHLGRSAVCVVDMHNLDSSERDDDISCRVIRLMRWRTGLCHLRCGPKNSFRGKELMCDFNVCCCPLGNTLLLFVCYLNRFSNKRNLVYVHIMLYLILSITADTNGT